MLHELLLSLLGQTGDIVQSGTTGFHISTKVAFISGPEREMILKIIQLGYHYARVEAFLEENYQQFASVGLQNIGGNEDEESVVGKSAYLKVNLIL